MQNNRTYDHFVHSHGQLWNGVQCDGDGAIAVIVNKMYAS